MNRSAPTPPGPEEPKSTPPNDVPPDGARVPTNLRTLRVLEALADAGVPLSPTEINRWIGLPKQSIHRICTTLVEQGILVYTADAKRLRPARRARKMAAGLLHSATTAVIRHQILKDVADRIGETINFVVPESAGMSYKDRVDTDWPFRVQLPVGSHVPFHCTASGKTYMASLPDDLRQLMVRSIRLNAHTGNTITDQNDLLAELNTIAKRGYALDQEEFMDGMVALAVPISDAKGNFLAALAFHGPTLRLNTQELADRFEVMREAAENISHVLVYE